MFIRQLFAGSPGYVLSSSAVLLAATPIIKSQESPELQEKSNKVVCRPSELSLYPSRALTVHKVKIEEPNEIEKLLIEPIGMVRSGVVDAVKEIKGFSSKTKDFISESSENFSFIVSYLREEDNEAQRVGAVAMGTLSGFIFGLRGGIIKKVTYSLIGTGAMGAICFPEQTNKYVSEGVSQGKLLANIGYNFIYGVKPGDPQHEIKFPEISMPKDFNQFVDLVTSIGKSVKDAIMPPPIQEEVSKTEDETKK